MKGAVLALFCAVALARAELNENGCPINPAIEILKPHPHCNKYYQCSQGELLERQCASTLVFNVNTQECDWPEHVYCGDRNPEGGNGGEEGGSGDGGTEDGNGGGGHGDGGNGDSGNGVNGDPSEAVKICAAEGSDGVLVAHENCNQFYKCSEGIPVALKCWGDLVFNPANNQCDWPENVNCDRNSDGGNNGADGGNHGEDGNGEDGNSDGDNGDGEDGGNGDNEGNDNPNEAVEICAAEGSDGILVAHKNCSQFYKCSEGVPVALNCWGNLLFNPVNNQCDWPENVNCDRHDDGGNNGADAGNGEGGNGEGGNADGDNGDGEDGGNGDNEGNDSPNEAVEICAAEGFDGILVAHKNCSQFYKCSEGVPVALNCWGNLLFNPVNNQCDWPENVNCDRNANAGNNGVDSGNGAGESGDSGDNEVNDNPNEAVEICAAEDSEGVLIAHENCNKFYMCNGGKPETLSCWGDLVYNPATKECDWRENVNCGSRNAFSSFNKHLRGAGRI